MDLQREELVERGGKGRGKIAFLRSDLQVKQWGGATKMDDEGNEELRQCSKGKGMTQASRRGCGQEHTSNQIRKKMVAWEPKNKPNNLYVNQSINALKSALRKKTSDNLQI